jgi:L-aspartate oxidase
VQESATSHAQGGIASVMQPGDSFESHIRDTLEAGAGLCRASVVDSVVRSGPQMIHQLQEFGVRFSGDAALALGREGGHSANRIVHFKDQTGWEVHRGLLAQARRHRNIVILENTLAVNLLGGARGEAGNGPGAVFGAYVLDAETRSISPIVARVTVLATGGCGKAYLYTSNPDVATGDGVAMAWRAGARIANMEFIQFHPTCLYDPNGSRFLISEAVRGEGGILRNAAGEAFMPEYDTRAELAPRDIVARALDQELKRTGDKCGYLDVSHIDPQYLRSRFPSIHSACAEAGIDMGPEWIPVVPAAHYMCGGILVDENGQTDLPHLYALGETSCTGLHGANRLASNSLLEALVFANRAVRDIGSRRLLQTTLPEVPPWSEAGTTEQYDTVVLDHDWDLVRRLLWDYVGIVRSDQRLEIAANRIAVMRRAIEGYYWQYRLSPDLVELRNLALVGDLIIQSARFRQESRGLHYTLDHPETDDAYRGDTILRRGTQPVLLESSQPVVTAGARTS